MENVNRRDFLATCAGHLVAAAVLFPRAASAWAQNAAGKVVAREPFGYLEQLSDGVWALISTPLQGERTTLCNGGIVAGRTSVVAVEAFNDPQGAAWLGERARELTGRWPTHVVMTHYHADHTNGVAGYLSPASRPVVRATGTTRDLVLQKKPADALRAALEDVVLLSPSDATSIDLGRRTLRVVPARGHTQSDVWIEVTDPRIVFGGDLLWNGMFPNYVDAMPGELARSVAALRSDRQAVYVPGHGAVARAPEVDRYVSVLDEVEHAARRARERGLTAAQGAAEFKLPASLGEWTLFSPAFFERAFVAWFKELPGSRGMF